MDSSIYMKQIKGSIEILDIPQLMMIFIENWDTIKEPKKSVPSPHICKLGYFYSIQMGLRKDFVNAEYKSLLGMSIFIHQQPTLVQIILFYF